jgi:3-keto-disaccharide hydrolase
MKSFGTIVIVAGLIVSNLPAGGQEPGFRSLFDGKTLNGWEGDTKVFRVADGAIVAGSPTEKIAHNDFLASRDEFGDFELRLKARLVGQGQNAGVQFRSQRIANHFEMIGYQCDMGTMQGRPIWGALYDESRRRKFLAEPDHDKLTAALKPADWNDLVIRCEGPRVQIWVNGLQTVDYTEPDADVPRRGRLGLQIHGGEPAEAAYKDIRIKQLQQ